MVEKIARSVRHFFAPQIPLEDLVQSGYVGLIEAAGRFDPAQGEFARFAYRRVRGAIIDAHKRQSYREEMHDSLDAIEERLGFLPAQMQTDPRPWPEAECLCREIDTERNRILARALNVEEEYVVRDALHGAPLSEIARRSGRTVEWARQRMASARQKLERAA
jgi:RNA polymerase sigma factor (sigma-70 family)